MLQYSFGVQLAWEISGYEAANKKSSYIEVDHIMLGILSLDKIQEHIKVQSDIDYKSFIYEKEKLYNTLKSFNLNITTIRRKLREMLPKSNDTPTDNIFHRSEDCKRMFTNATCLATNFLTINHLFLTMIDWERSNVKHLLISEKVNIDQLKSDIMFSFYTKN